MRVLLMAAVLAVVASAPSAAGQSITYIQINAHWGGLGGPIDEHFQIERRGNTYRSGLGRVDAERVWELQRAVAAPVFSEEDGLRELANRQWLAEHASSSYGVLTSAQGECSPDARRLFIEAFSQPARAVGALREHYSLSHTDDFPSITVRVRATDGDIEIASYSQHALMLPWKTSAGLNWNPAISRAIGALMPSHSKLRPRLLDESLAHALAWQIGEDIREKREALEERCLYQGVADGFERRSFRIIEIYHAWPGQFAAHIHSSDFPRNLIIDAHIDVDSKTVSALPNIIHQIEAYVSTARTFVESHPETTFEMWFRDGVSLTDDSIQLHEIGSADSANTNRARAVQSRCVLLRDHKDYRPARQWVILPSGEAIDWQE
jgi:hypothetical protein